METDELRKVLGETTPGPWEVRFGGDAVWAGNMPVADVCTPKFSRDKMPNARLIAMAPDLAAEVLRLRAEVEHFTRSGIVEIAARNPSVMEYMKHWEGRAEKAEAEVERLRAAMDAIAEWMDDPEAPGTKNVGGVRGAKAIARAALKAKGTE